MEFGAVEDINKVDFKLPSDHLDTLKALGGKPAKKPEVWVGCAKWARKDWLGKIYPAKTKDKDFLEHYIQHFNSVELNATYHRIPSPSVIKSWSEKADKHKFKFFPKFSREISHTSTLIGKESLVKRFLETTGGFGDHLGAYFMMLPPSFSIKRFPELKTFLEQLPKDISLFLEFRHVTWFTDSPEAEEAFEFFRKNNFGVLITDTAGRRDCIHMRLTGPEAFIRFTGYGLHPKDFKRIDEWVERIDTWLSSGLKQLYFFVHNDSEENEVHSPELGAYAVKQMNKQLGLNLPEPKIIQANTLF